MTEYHIGPPPVVHSDCVYEYPADPPSRPLWLTIVAVTGVCVAVIAMVIAATVIAVRKSDPTVIIPDWPAPPSTVTSVSTVTTPVPVPGPRATVTAAPPSLPRVTPPPPASVPVSSCQLLRNQANADYSVVSSEATGLWVPQLSSKQPGLVADGITWDCNSILAEHLRLRGLYGAKLLWSGDWPHTFGHDDYWVTVAGYTYDTAEGARQWCQDHGRDVPEHCYPTQIR